MSSAQSDASVTVQELQKKLLANDPQETICLIDVRTAAEYRGVHVEAAEHMALDQINAAEVKQLAEDLPVYVICASGKRSSMAIEKLQAEGLTQLTNVIGGTSAWVEAGLPVVRGAGVISIERQVRIGAGFLVLSGVLLGFFVHLGFLGLSAFVGAGLMFAGITDFCGMGLVLARMPWNK